MEEPTAHVVPLRVISVWHSMVRRYRRLSFKRGCYGRLGHWLRVIKDGRRLRLDRPWIIIEDDASGYWGLFVRKLWRIAFKRRCWANLGQMLRDIKSRRELPGGATRC